MPYTINTDIIMSGSAIEMGTSKITGLGTPTLGTDATTKAYVDTEIAAGVVSLFTEDVDRNIVGGASAGAAIIAGGTDNFIAGNLAGTALTSGDNNILLGSRSGTAITTALSNIAIGPDSLNANQTVSSNVAIGKNALLMLIGGAGNNISIGDNSQTALTTGESNVSLGSAAIPAITAGIRNTAMGHNTGTNVTGASNDNIFIGNAAGPSTVGVMSNALYINNAVSDTPLIHGDFSTTTVTINGDINASGASNLQEDLGEFLLAGLPAAATNANKWALVTDAVGGRTVVRSDGTAWKIIAVEGLTVS